MSTGAVSTVTAAVHGPRDLRLSELSGGGATGSGRSPSPQEEHPQLPHTRLRQGVRQDVPSESAPAMAHGRAAVRLQLVVLWQAVHQKRRAAETSPHPHRREEVDLLSVRGVVVVSGSVGLFM